MDRHTQKTKTTRQLTFVIDQAFLKNLFLQIKTFCKNLQWPVHFKKITI